MSILVIAGVGNDLTLSVVKALTEIDLTAMQLYLAVLSGRPPTLAFLMMGPFLGA